MVLTGIVVAVSATAFALALIRSIHLPTEDDAEDTDGDQE
jgi:multisubunit Na+/H+ antiporter MnhC subunit